MPKAAPIEGQLFRDIMAGFPSGVTIVTALTEGGTPRGLTVSAFASVSLDPPQVLVCIERSANTLPAIVATGGFTVNFLGAQSAGLSVRFSLPTDDKFDGVGWSKPGTPQAGPVLDDGIIAFIECTVDQAVDAGDHVIVVGAVRQGWWGGEAEPLVHWRRQYLRLAR